MDRAAAPAVAAIGAAARDVRLTTERRGPVAAAAGADVDLDLVEEHREVAIVAGAARSRVAPQATRSRDRRSGRLEVAERVDPVAAAPDRAAPDLEVEVRPGGLAGLTDSADLLAARDCWPAPTVIADMWLYVVYSPEPWAIQTW